MTPTPPVERHIRVTRSARYYVMGDLSAATDVWIALHGYGQLAGQFIGALAPVIGEGRAVVAPEALSRFYLDEPFKRHGPDSPVGASWMTAKDRLREIDDYVNYLSEVASEVKQEAPSATLTVLGFSQGVAAACRFAALGAARVNRLILWGGSLAADLPTDRGDQLFKGASVVLVAGRTDVLVPIKYMQKERATLGENGIQAQLLEHDGGHSLNSDLLRELAG